MKPGTIRIGTSGWMYKEWGKKFYPEDLPENDHLKYYASQFDTLEINSSFYHLPKAATFKQWKERTPPGFIFAVKMSRYITHLRRLKEPKEALENFFANASNLDRKLGPVLIQLPPNLAFDPERLENFLEELKLVQKGFKKRLRIALEIRHKSWFEPQNTEKLAAMAKKFKIALVFAHSSKFPYFEEEPVTANFIYLRFHGPKEFAGSLYGAKLKEWIPKIRTWAHRGLDIYVYFNNDQHAYAIKDVLALKQNLQNPLSGSRRHHRQRHLFSPLRLSFCF